MVISKNICTFASLLNNKNMTANEIRDSFCNSSVSPYGYQG